MPARQYWLVKSEPDVFSFDALLAAPRKTTCWSGVRNYAARIHLRAMKKGDLVFYYHSNADPSVIVGVCEVVKEAYPDHTAFDANDDYYDPKSKPEDPTWFMVDLKALEKLARPVSLDEIKKTKSLQQMALVKLGRLSVSPVTEQEYETIRAMSAKKQKG